MGKNEETGKLADCVDGFDADQSHGLTAAQLVHAYKATLSDFVRGKACRNNVAEITNLLKGALAARRQQLLEEGNLTSQRCRQFFYE